MTDDTLKKVLDAAARASERGFLKIESFIEEDGVVYGLDNSGAAVMIMPKESYESLKAKASE